jgi:hypothetical protein
MNLENEKSYYVGGSLCIDFDDYPSVVLNRNGRGFFYQFKKSHHKEIKFVIPKDIQDLVLYNYNKYKAV